MTEEDAGKLIEACRKGFASPDTASKGVEAKKALESEGFAVYVGPEVGSKKSREVRAYKGGHRTPSERHFVKPESEGAVKAEGAAAVPVKATLKASMQVESGDST